MYRGNLDEKERDQIIRELGEKLHDIRKAQDFSIAIISDITKIQKNYLVAIEEGNLSKLPKGPYIRGFIRQYCEFLSAMDLWNAYDAVTQTETPQLEEKTNEAGQGCIAAPTMFKISPRWWIYIVIIISLVSAGWVTWNYRGEITGISTSPIGGGAAAVSHDKQEPATVSSADITISEDSIISVDLNWMDGRPAAVTPASQEADPSTANQQDAQEPTQSAATAAMAPTAKNTLHIKAIAKVWLSVSSGKQSLYMGTINFGESKSFTITNKAVRVRYGNPSGAVVTWNGSTANPLGGGAKPMTRTYHPNGKVTEEQ